MSSCLEFFAELDLYCDEYGGHHRGDKLRGYELDAEKKKANEAARVERLLQWEQERASQHSPGPVGSEELLRRAIRNEHDTAEGELLPLAFSDIEKLGLSTDRCEHADVLESRERAFKQARARHKTPCGYVEIDTSFLRSLNVDSEDKTTQVRALAVFDTAVELNTSHAEVFCIHRYSNKRPHKAVMQDLFDEYAGSLAAWPNDEGASAR